MGRASPSDDRHRGLRHGRGVAVRRPHQGAGRAGGRRRRRCPLRGGRTHRPARRRPRDSGGAAPLARARAPRREQARRSGGGRRGPGDIRAGAGRAPHRLCAARPEDGRPARPPRRGPGRRRTAEERRRTGGPAETPVAIVGRPERRQVVALQRHRRRDAYDRERDRRHDARRDRYRGDDRRRHVSLRRHRRYAQGEQGHRCRVLLVLAQRTEPRQRPRRRDRRRRDGTFRRARPLHRDGGDTERLRHGHRREQDRPGRRRRWPPTSRRSPGSLDASCGSGRR